MAVRQLQDFDAEAHRLPGVALERVVALRHDTDAWVVVIRVGALGVVDSLEVGPIRLTRAPVEINRAPMSSSLLGMPFLKRLESFEVRGDQLILRGRGAAK